AAAATSQQSRKPLAPGQGIEWQGDWAAAVKEATARNVPIVLTIHKDNCPRCKAMEEETLRNAKVIELSRSFVNVVAHRDTAHGSSEALRGRDKVMLCNDYGNIPCEVHVKGWGAIGQFIQGTFGTPTTVFCDPSGKELSRHEGDPGSADMIKEMNDALSKVSGDHIPQALWSQAVQLRTDAEAALQKEDLKKASDLTGKLGKMKGSPFKTMSQELSAKIDEKGAEALKAALAIESIDQKKAALKKLLDEVKGLPVALEAKKELDALK
ncbi:MAG TPA: thioredoxin family protein, partial [Planctomycetota bacterium]|nr:thioredoxin family protein [Planctomycetota bacterium]